AFPRETSGRGAAPRGLRRRSARPSRWRRRARPGRRGSLLRPPRVEVDDARERRLADATEGHLVPGEHDAVLLGPEVTTRLVHRALERPDLPGVLIGAEDATDLGLLAGEERVHLRLRPPVGADLLALGLDGPAVGLELVLSPRRGERRVGGEERFPLRLPGVLQRGDVEGAPLPRHAAPHAVAK